jgi:hypothetical protein
VTRKRTWPRRRKPFSAWIFGALLLAVSIPGVAQAQNLSYHGGPVLHNPTIVPFYWVPAGYSYPAGYQAFSRQVLSDVAAAGGTPGSLIDVLAQYADSSGPAGTQMSVGGPITDTDRFPASGCSVPGQPVCLTEAQIQGEIYNEIKAQPYTSQQVYEVFLPTGTESCLPEGAECTGSGEAACSYHAGTRWLANQMLLFTVLPVPPPASACLVVQPSANGAVDDGLASMVVGETAGALISPLGDGWYADGVGIHYDIDSYCATSGSPMQTAPSGGYTARLGSNGYDVQGLWSNALGGCTFNGTTVAGTSSPDPTAPPPRSSGSSGSPGSKRPSPAAALTVVSVHKRSAGVIAISYRSSTGARVRVAVRVDVSSGGHAPTVLLAEHATLAAGHSGKLLLHLNPAEQRRLVVAGKHAVLTARLLTA